MGGKRFAYTEHALEQMVEREITEDDVNAALAYPTKRRPGDNGCVNLWGYGPSEKRIRVTVDMKRRRIITVANADSRVR